MGAGSRQAPTTMRLQASRTESEGGTSGTAPVPKRSGSLTATSLGTAATEADRPGTPPGLGVGVGGATTLVRVRPQGPSHKVTIHPRYRKPSHDAHVQGLSGQRNERHGFLESKTGTRGACAGDGPPRSKVAVREPKAPL